MANANMGKGPGKERANIINVVAAAAAALGDLIIFGPWVGIACNTAAIGETLTLDIEEGKEWDAVSDVSGVGAAVGDEVYYNPTTGAFGAEAATGYYLVGHVTVAIDANDCFRFEKLRHHVPFSAVTFAGLADVDVAGVTDNDTLKFVASTGKWTDVAV